MGEEVHPLRWALGAPSSALLLTCSLCFMPAVEDASFQLSAPTAAVEDVSFQLSAPAAMPATGFLASPNGGL